MKKNLIMAVMTVSISSVVSCSSNEEEIQETAKSSTVVTLQSNEGFSAKETDSIPSTNTTTTIPGDGVDDGIIPPKKP